MLITKQSFSRSESANKQAKPRNLKVKGITAIFISPKLRIRNTNLVISREQLPKLTYNPRQRQLSDSKQFCIDDSHGDSKHKRKEQNWQLSFYNTRKQSPPMNEDLRNSSGTICLVFFNVHLIDDTRDELCAGHLKTSRQMKMLSSSSVVESAIFSRVPISQRHFMCHQNQLVPTVYGCRRPTCSYSPSKLQVAIINNSINHLQLAD